MNYVTNVNLDELYNLSIQIFYWRSFSVSFDQFCPKHLFLRLPTKRESNHTPTHHASQRSGKANCFLCSCFGFDAHRWHLFLLFSYLLDGTYFYYFSIYLMLDELEQNKIRIIYCHTRIARAMALQQLKIKYTFSQVAL